jgi:hypothetical protein
LRLGRARGQDDIHLQKTNDHHDPVFFLHLWEGGLVLRQLQVGLTKPTPRDQEENRDKTD